MPLVTPIGLLVWPGPLSSCAAQTYARWPEQFDVGSGEGR